MAVRDTWSIRDTRFGGNLERANTGIRSLPQRDTISRADRESYGHGQIYNPQMGARDVSGYMEDDDYFNPNVFSRQMAVEGFPNAPREIANQSNFGGPFSSPANLRESINYINAIKNNRFRSDNTSLIDPMYRDLYPELFNVNPSTADLYKSKEEQMEDAGPFEAMQMERYGRENPFLQILKGIQTTTGPNEYGQYETTEKMVDPGVYAMSPAELSYMYGASTDAPMTTRPNQFYPDEKYLPSPYTPPSDRQPGLDYTAPALPPGNIGFDRSPNPQALPPLGAVDFTYPKGGGIPYPEGIGLDRSPEEILTATEVDEPSIWDKVSPFIPPMPGMPWFSQGMANKALDLFSQDDIYQDPIMDMAKFQEYEDRGLAPMNDELAPMNDEVSNLEDDEILRIMNQYKVGPEEARRLYDEMIYGYERDRDIG